MKSINFRNVSLAVLFFALAVNAAAQTKGASILVHVDLEKLVATADAPAQYVQLRDHLLLWPTGTTQMRSAMPRWRTVT